tara:strand:- start:2476 stop:2724 length:249 start_codon:yes stop_codon:yes gene_type:complete
MTKGSNFHNVELEPPVRQAIHNSEIPFENGLLQNNESISLESAKDYNSLLLLRWRYRQCVSCDQSFDITSQGFLYKCGGCIE